MTKILVMAAGTGGHVIPALCFADLAASKGNEIHWLGTEEGLEKKLVKHYPLHTIPMRGVRHVGWRRQLLSPFFLILSFWQSLRLMRRIRPEVVVGFGGFVSVPGGMAAKLLRKKLVIHEQNAYAGSANRLLSKMTTHVFEAFSGSFPNKKNCIGNPIRQALLTLPNPKLRLAQRSGPYRLLVIGGSRGASALNQAMPKVFAQLAENHALEIRHQTGIHDQEAVVIDYKARGLTASVEPFIEDMAAAYAWADLVVCRSGALTVSELMAVGLPAVFIPYPQAVDDHQTANARVMQKRGAAVIVPQGPFFEEALCKAITPLLQRETLQQMALLAYSDQTIKAEECLLRACLEEAVA